MILLQEHEETLDLLERLVNAGKLQKECIHGAESDYCDDCAVLREKEVAEVRAEAREHLRRYKRLPKTPEKP